MKFLFCLLAGLGIFCTNIFAQQPSPKKVVIKGVKIISMDPGQPRVTDNSDVFIENGKIKKIKASTRAKDKGYEAIEGTGKYLIPGMADMHVHLPHPSSEIQAGEFYLLYLLNGVTIVRQMRGKPSDLLVRDSIRKGLMPGCYTHISTPPFFWISDDFKKNLFNATMCRDSLTKFKDQGYDFVKFVGALSPTQYDTLSTIAASLNLKLTGHAPQNDLVKATDANQYTIEHIEPFVKLYQKDSVLFWKTIEKMVEKNLFNCPDVVWYFRTGSSASSKLRRGGSGKEYIDSTMFDTSEKDMTEFYISSYKKDPLAFAKSIIRDSTQTAIYKYLLPGMQKRELKLLVSGSDGDFIVPGFSFHDEMDLFASSGIPTYDVIRCATTNAAECLGETNTWGKISKGMRADMVLLAGNPLEDMANLHKVDATIINGKVLTKEYLIEELRKVQAGKRKK